MAHFDAWHFETLRMPLYTFDLCRRTKKALSPLPNYCHNRLELSGVFYRAVPVSYTVWSSDGTVVSCETDDRRTALRNRTSILRYGQRVGLSYCSVALRSKINLLRRSDMRVLYRKRIEMLLRRLTPTEAAAERLQSAKLMEAYEDSGRTTCRCLFGRPSSDIAAVQSYLDEYSRRRWNFDFIAMQPQPGGRFDWSRCAAEAVPMMRSAISSTPVVTAGSSDWLKDRCVGVILRRLHLSVNSTMPGQGRRSASFESCPSDCEKTVSIGGR